VFDELIRQETINCAERGLLLLRVRYYYYYFPRFLSLKFLVDSGAR
jgi:hypothetical protein